MIDVLIWLLLAIVAPCPTEDSDNCAWDAQARGNGVGSSFYVLDGQYTEVAR